MIRGPAGDSAKIRKSHPLLEATTQNAARNFLLVLVDFLLPLQIILTSMPRRQETTGEGLRQPGGPARILGVSESWKSRKTPPFARVHSLGDWEKLTHPGMSPAGYTREKSFGNERKTSKASESIGKSFTIGIRLIKYLSSKQAAGRRVCTEGRVS